MSNMMSIWILVTVEDEMLAELLVLNFVDLFMEGAYIVVDAEFGSDYGEGVE